MHRTRVWFVAVGLAAVVMVLSARGDTPDSYSQIKVARTRRLELLQRRGDLEHRRTLLNPRSLVAADSRARATDIRSLAVGTQAVRVAELAHGTATPPPPSPGVAMGNTTWDAQHEYSAGYQTARLSGSNTVHFCWMAWDRFPSDVNANDRYVAYNSWDIPTSAFNQGFGGVFLGLDNQARAGYTNLDVDHQNLAHIALQQRQDPAFPYHCWRILMPIEGAALHVDDELSGTGTRCPQTLWPRIASARDGNPADTVVVHEIGIEDVNDCINARVFYWRNTGGPWQGPVVIDSSEFTGYVIADCPTNNKVAVALHPIDGNTLFNVCYHESNTAGYGWLTGAELGSPSRHYITNYTDPNGPQAWPDLSTTYDNNGVLHVVYLEQKVADQSERIKILHWNSSRNTSRPVALSEYDGLYGASLFNLNLAKVTVGIGDGSSLCPSGAGDESNNNYVYVSYIKFGGETAAEQADISVGGYWNGELYLTVSNSGGNTWSPPVNLTNTKTPNCNPGLADTSTGIPAKPDSVCRSEHWQTIGRAVSDVDILFISDLDAGAAPYGEGTWQMNPVHYLRLPKGTHAQYVCPVIAPVFEATLTAAQECEYHSTRTGTDVETLTILNLGNATLSGSVSVTDFPGAATLTLSGGVGAYSISAGGADVVKSVTMAANNTFEGLFQGSISITHNDVTKTSPRVYPIDYFVVNNFFCPEDEVLKTGVASPGSLALRVESDGRFASRYDFGGLWRFKDTSSSIYDASLLVAHGTQGPDTTVFLHFGTRQSNGQFGFRALTDLVIDTSKYGTNSGDATAVAYMCTADSVVGIKMSWFFPQQYTKDEYVIAQYKVFRNRPTVPITNLCIGVLEDQDVLPAARYGTIQTGAENQAAGNAARKLGYQIGVDTVGSVISGTPPRTATRYRGGVAACGSWKGVHVGNNIDDIEPGGGPTDGFLYRQLTSLNGVDLFTDSTVDLYTLMALDAGKSIGAGETLTYTVIYASDTISDASFGATVDAGLAAASAANLCPNTCNCPCKYDPRCDGVISDVLDVADAVSRAFRGFAPTMDPQCPYERSDVDASGETDMRDVCKIISVAFRGSTAGSQYDLDPCTPGDQLAASAHSSRFGQEAAAASSSSANAVVVESKTVAPSATAVTIGVYITNDMPITGLLLPLELRSLSGGAYIVGATGWSRGINPSGRMQNSPLGPGGTPSASVTNRTFANPDNGGSGCVRPTDPSNSWNTATANPDANSPDAILLATISQGDPGAGQDIDLDPGSDPPGIPSYQIVFNVNAMAGEFVIDTTCIRPANHLAFNPIDCSFLVPNFSAGLITVGTPVDCSFKSSIDPYLLACPKGDVPFAVTLRDATNQPIAGYGNVQLDFSGCASGQLIPKPGLYPSWPIVPAPEASDSAGVIRFFIAAGGDCANCSVTITTGCGLARSVPVRSLDVNGNLCVEYTDHDDAEGNCRDYNADGMVNAADFGRHLAHFGHCFPSGRCDQLNVGMVLAPEGSVKNNDTVTVDWALSNTGPSLPCTVDSIAFYSLDSDSGTAIWLGVTTVGATLAPSQLRTGRFIFVNHRDVNFCVEARTYSDCCPGTYASSRNCVTAGRICPVKDTCFAFYISPLDIVALRWSPASLLANGWHYEVKDTNITVSGSPPRDVTQTRICTSPFSVVGDSGILAIYHNGYGSPKIYKVVMKRVNGDICGGSNLTPDCIVDVLDVVCEINYCFRGGAPPDPPSQADLNCDHVADLLDVVLVINIAFRGGTAPPDCGIGPAAF